MVSKRTLLEHSREAWRWPIPKHFADPSGLWGILTRGARPRRLPCTEAEALEILERLIACHAGRLREEGKDSSVAVRRKCEATLKAIDAARNAVAGFEHWGEVVGSPAGLCGRQTGPHVATYAGRGAIPSGC